VEKQTFALRDPVTNETNAASQCYPFAARCECSDKIADLTDAATLRALGTNRGELTALLVDKRLGNAPTQILGRVAYDTGRIEGLLAWSRVSTREKNLILFPDRLGMGYDLHDPSGDLPSIHPAIMEALRSLMQID
jgi:hypothetical protein